MVEVDSGEGPQLFTDTSNYAKDRFFLVVVFLFLSKDYQLVVARRKICP